MSFFRVPSVFRVVRHRSFTTISLPSYTLFEQLRAAWSKLQEFCTNRKADHSRTPVPFRHHLFVKQAGGSKLTSFAFQVIFASKPGYENTHLAFLHILTTGYTSSGPGFALPIAFAAVHRTSEASCTPTHSLFCGYLFCGFVVARRFLFPPSRVCSL